MSAKSKPALGAGNVEIELGGETLVLKPTLAAAQALSRQSGGIIAAMRGVADFNLDTVSAVIGVGLGLSGKDAKDLPERIYETGMVDLVPRLSKFLSNVANGGRPIDDDDKGGNKGEGDDPNG